jgi:hypothetical protein
MSAYNRLVNLARLCVKEARLTQDKSTAGELWLLAREYQERAAKLDGGRLPDIEDGIPYTRAPSIAGSG